MESKIQCPICFPDRMCFDEYVEKDNYHSYHNDRTEWHKRKPSNNPNFKTTIFIDNYFY